MARNPRVVFPKVEPHGLEDMRQALLERRFPDYDSELDDVEDVDDPTGAEALAYDRRLRSKEKRIIKRLFTCVSRKESLQHARADYGFWCRLQVWELHEIPALTYGCDPTKVDADGFLAPTKNASAIGAVKRFRLPGFEKRKRLVKNWLQNAPNAKPEMVLRCMKESGIRVPPAWEQAAVDLRASGSVEASALQAARAVEADTHSSDSDSTERDWRSDFAALEMERDRLARELKRAKKLLKAAQGNYDDLDGKSKRSLMILILTMAIGTV